MKAITVFFCFISIILYGQIEKNFIDLSEYPNKYILSSLINETSAVEYYKNYLYTCNDSGGKAEVYKLNSSNGNVLQTIST